MNNKKYIAPKIFGTRFTCPHCNTLSQQVWSNCKFYNNGSIFSTSKDSCFFNGKKIIVSVSTCQSCCKPHIWIEDKMVQPFESNIPYANDGMPDNIKEIYNEAREVFPISPKAAAALLRLALQYLCIELGGKGKNINDDIAKMVTEGLPVQIQQALDIVRVVGNNAVHPGNLNLNDNNEIAIALFDIINIIVENRIVQPKKIDEFYNSLPEKALIGIKKRDNK
ncbi:DUF4145 domain-containing protein [Clostridium perfringens]|uniref:DUF4145 domain-containing protein n=1 Tax=Clostridium perfringens TaxID=1502 RepID=UPI001ABBB5B2|nr:DUF4145 domain-containing protein [Clostridium perfringens]MBO3361362.1 DUF4145 domain-containing protein [Clostridium perfringens]